MTDYRIILLFMFLLFNGTYHAVGQYFHFSQYGFTDQRVSLGKAAVLDHATVSMIYRNQQAADNFNVKSTFMSASYPFRNKKGPSSAVSFSLLDDRSGEVGLFKTNVLGLAYDVSVPVSAGQELAFSMRSDWHNRQVSLDGLFTGSQFVPNRGFEGLPTDGALDQFRASFFTWSTGLYWIRNLKDGRQGMHLGMSFFDINRPDESFFDQDSKLPSSLVVSTGVRVYTGQVLSVYPELLLTSSASRTTTVAGAITSYDITSGRWGNRLNFITKYAFAGYIIAGVQLEAAKTSFGFSYDIPTSRQVGNNSAVEFAFQWREPVKENSSKNRIKRRRVKRSKYARDRLKRIRQVARRKKRNSRQKLAKKTDARNKPQVNDGVEPRANDRETGQIENRDKALLAREDMETVHEENTTIKKEPDGAAKAGLIRHYPFNAEVVRLQFKFPFNKSEIQAEDAETLHDIVALLQEDANLLVDVIGHTDDVGHEEFNQRLSLRRAMAVRDYLTKNGIRSERIRMEGRGELEPLVENNSDRNRAINRRVEFKLHY